MTDEPKIPNTARFWRLNTIEALRMSPAPYFCYDPESHAQATADRDELKRLCNKENAIRARAERIFKKTWPTIKP